MLGGWDALVAHHLLEDVLVHAERGGEDTRADVRDPGELQQALHGAVLAMRAVQQDEHDVERAERSRRAVGRHRQRLGGPSCSSGAAAARGSAHRPSRPISTVCTS